MVHMLRDLAVCGIASFLVTRIDAWSFMDENVLNGPDDCDGCDGLKKLCIILFKIARGLVCAI